MQAIHISSYNNIIMAHNLQHTKYNNKNIMHIYDTIQIEFIIRLLFNIYIYIRIYRTSNYNKNDITYFQRNLRHSYRSNNTVLV